MVRENPPDTLPSGLSRPCPRHQMPEVVAFHFLHRDVYDEGKVERVGS